MRNQVLLVVGLIGVILGSAANAADIYDVWAGNTDYRLAPESWDIFYSIDQYDYVKLGGASGSALFSGSYRFYVVAARSTLFVDSVQEPVSGAYIGSAHTTGNLTGLSNISGPPDGQYTFFNGAMNSGGTYGAFVVMECSAYPNWAGIRVITGTYGSPIFSSGTSDFSDVPFMHVRPGDTRTYVGRGAYAGARYTQTFTEETFLNVTCLKVQESAVAWAGKEGIVVHLAKDTTGGCWLFRLEVEGAIVFAAPTQTEAIPFAVVPEMNMRLAASAWSVGTAIFGFDAATEEVVSDSATLPEFPGWQLVKTKWTSNDGLDVDWTYYHHSLGKVLDVWDDAGNTSGDGWMLEDSGATEWTLIIQAPQGVGTTSPGPGAYTYGVGMASVPITATPALGWRFDHWTGASTSSSATLCVESGTASEIKVLKPVFVQQGTWTLTIEAAEGNGYTTPPAGTYTYYIGQSSPPITATAAQGWGFDQWQCPQSDSFEGSYRSVSNPIVISGEGSTKTLKAVFMPGLIRTFHDTEPVLSVAFSPDGARMLTGTAHEYYPGFFTLRSPIRPRKLISPVL